MHNYFPLSNRSQMVAINHMVHSLEFFSVTSGVLQGSGSFRWPDLSIPPTSVPIQVCKMLYISLVRSQLTYWSMAWRPQHLKEIFQLERVQRRVTKSSPIIISLFPAFNMMNFITFVPGLLALVHLERCIFSSIHQIVLAMSSFHSLPWLWNLESFFFCIKEW